MAIYLFPYLRKGISNGITKGELKAGKTRAELDVKLSVDYHRVDRQKKAETPKAVTIQLIGPADVKSLNKRAVSHFFPPESAAIKMTSVYMPYMEFFEEDLPWRYTPLPVERDAANKEVVLPWMALIAVRKEEVSFRISSAGIRIATLNISDQQRFSEIFAQREALLHSAHVQIESARAVSDVDAVLTDNPDCGISRLFCMSTLTPDTEYYALLIPVFESGRLAGLGLSTAQVSADTLAWSAKADGWTQQANEGQHPDGWSFPVYYRWKFLTAKTGDFKSLAEKLAFTSANDYKTLASSLTVDISSSGLPDYESKRPSGKEEVIDVQAALKLMGTAGSSRTESQDYRRCLKDLLKDNPVFQENATGAANEKEDPWVVPPIYGARQVLATALDTQTGANKLVSEVNLQLSNRIVAGMGSSVVKENQEQFVNRAWRKVEKINEVNQKIREYYQILQANKQAQKKYDFKSLRSKKDRIQVTDKRRALGLDVTYRTLQASGIFKRNVTAERLLEQASADPKLVSRMVKRGITPSEILSIFDSKMWSERAKKENRNLAIINSFKQNRQFIGPFEDYDYLEDLLDLEYYKQQFSFTSEAGREYLTPVSGGMSDEDYHAAFDMAATAAKSLYYTVVKSTLAAIPKGSLLDKTDNNKKLRPMQLQLKTPAGLGFLLRQSDALILGGSKALAVEYKEWQKDTKATTQKYLYITSWDKLESNFPGKVTYWLKTPARTVRLQRQGNVFKPMNNSNWWHNIPFHYKTLTSLPFYQDLVRFRQVFAELYGWAFLRSNSDRCSLFTLADGRTLVVDWSLKKNFVDFYLYPANTTVKVKKLNSAYIMPFRFAYNDATMKFNGHVNSDKNSIELKISQLHNALDEVIRMLENIERVRWEPNYVEIADLNEQTAGVKVIRAQEIADKPGYDDDDYGDQAGENLPKQVAEKVSQVAGSIGKWLERDMVEQQDSGKAKPISDIDPNQLAAERIAEIISTYGDTEDNQVEVNCDSKYPVMAYPDFLDPTFFYLRQLSEAYVLPSSGSLGKNTITCFVTNPAFEEAFLMGMNTEMGRELLWREYPTDQRGSYFRKFWDQLELPLKKDLEKKYYDVQALHQWKAPLGQNHTAGKQSMTVFAIKGELMQAYPKTAVYLATSNYLANREKAAKERISAEMMSWLSESTCLIGFKASLDVLRGKLLVFEQERGNLQYRLAATAGSTANDSMLINGGYIKLETPTIYTISLSQLMKI